jgi:hypothetical protein
MAGPEGAKNLAGQKGLRLDSDPFNDAEFGENYANLSRNFFARADCDEIVPPRARIVSRPYGFTAD